jgi:hypothetical protein
MKRVNVWLVDKCILIKINVIVIIFIEIKRLNLVESRASYLSRFHDENLHEIL